MVVERARLRFVGGEAVRVLPERERTVAHHIAKLPVGDVVAVFEGPGGGKGAGMHLQHHLGPVPDAAGVLEHLGAIPRRREAREGARALMPREQRLNRHGGLHLLPEFLH